MHDNSMMTLKCSSTKVLSRIQELKSGFSLRSNPPALLNYGLFQLMTGRISQGQCIQCKMWCNADSSTPAQFSSIKITCPSSRAFLMLSAASLNKVAGDALPLHHEPDYTGVYHIAGPVCLYR